MRGLLATAISVLLLAGCSNTTSPSPAAQSSNAAAQQREVGERLFQSAVDMMNHLGDYDESHVEAAVSQIVRRLNESFATISPGVEKTDPYQIEDGKYLREVVWLRDAARFAVGNETDPLRRAELLFDWTIRNVQLIPPDDEELLPYLPWHIQLFGRGSAVDRAWLFCLLARQQLLDVVLLAAPADDAKQAPTQVWPALVHNGELYVFDARLGLPIPGPKGASVATLKQLAADDALLRALDLEEPAGKYPLTAAEAGKLAAYVETSSNYAAPRFTRLETALSGDDKLLLTIDVGDLTARVKQCGVADVRPWPLRDGRQIQSREKAAYDRLVTIMGPLQFGRTVRTPPLWVARVRHIAGNYDYGSTIGKPTIARAYQEARLSEAELAPLQRDKQLWLEAHLMKEHATYWLGLVSYDLGNYDTAAQYFDLVLKDKANGGWTRGARYNLGRTYEAWKKPDKALETYRATFLDLPPDAECLIRAKRLATTQSLGG